jgi:predicted amidohydrolase YtcJ
VVALKRLGLLALVISLSGPLLAGDLVVYTAARIITMEPALPEATAVAVADGRIVAVGILETLQPLIEAGDATIDRRLGRHVLLPGGTTG